MIYERSLLFGRWYRHDIDEQGFQITEYSELNDDGHFEFTFSTLDSQGNIIEKTVEFGDWGLVGDIHFTLTKNEIIEQEYYTADLTNDDNYQAYRVLQLNHQTFQYQHIVTEEIFIMRRVTDNVGHC
ncbi:MAG: hypothetical protein OCD00_00605 [Colwellia sp.]